VVNVNVPRPAADPPVVPADNFTASLIRSSTTADRDFFKTKDTIENGTCTFDPVISGTYKLIVDSPGYMTGTVTNIEVSPANSPITVDLTLEAAYSLNLADGCLYRINLYTGEAVLVAPVFEEGIATLPLNFSGIEYTAAAVTGLTFNPKSVPGDADYGLMYAVAFYAGDGQPDSPTTTIQQIITINPTTGEWAPLPSELNIAESIVDVPFALTFDRDGKLWVSVVGLTGLINFEGLLYEVNLDPSNPAFAVGEAMNGYDIDHSVSGEPMLLFGLAPGSEASELYAASFKSIYTVNTIPAGTPPDMYVATEIGPGSATLIFPLHGLDVDGHGNLWSINLLGNIRQLSTEQGYSTIVSNCQDGYVGLGIYPAPDEN